MRSVSRWTSVVILWLSLVGGFLTARIVVLAVDQKEHRTSVDASISPLLTTSTTPTAHSEPVVATTTMMPALPPAQFGNRFVFLPLIVRTSQFQPQPPTPTPPPSTSLLSISCDNGVCQFNNAGAFLGNRPAQDWNQKDPGTALDPENPDPANPNYFPFLCRVQGNELNCPNTQNEEQLPGIWPAVVVVLGDQVFDKERYAPGEAAPDGETKCNIRRVFVSSGRQYIFRYLKQASQRDIPIIVRLTSPGNFQDSVIDNEEDIDNPEYEHRILLGAGETPLKADGITRRTYCDEDSFRDGRNNLPGYLSFRDVDELLDEMEQIIIFLQTDHPDFDISNLYFLPANEPNGEWYQPGWWRYRELIPDPNNPPADLNPGLLYQFNPDGTLAWDDMNKYFSALHRRKGERGLDNVQLLTPPMGPGRQAEYFTQDCRRQRLFPGVGAVPIEVSGYERMLLDDPATTEIEGMLLPNFNEGYTWNNYWDPGREAWTTPNSRGEPSVGCEDIPPGNPSRTDHIYQLFPPDLQTHIQNDLSFIVEADLKSPRGPQGGTIRNPDDPDLNGSKDENNIGNAAGTANSIATFVNNEVTNGAVDFVSLWLLTVDFNADPDNAATVETGCQALDNRDNPFLIAGREELWHQAYLPDGTECQWFRILWSRP